MSEVFDFMVWGMGMQDVALPCEPEAVDCLCDISQERISTGCPTGKIIPKTVNDVLDLVHGQSGYISESAARLFKGCWNLGSRAIFEDGSYHPLINSEEAEKQGRASWSGLIREIWQSRKGQRCVLILATDFKKRVWYKAQLGTVGAHTPLLIYAPDYGVGKMVYLNWRELVQTLDLVETVYSMGFSKIDIADTLFRNFKLFQENPDAVMQYETELRAVRGSDVFVVSTIVCQRKDDNSEAI